MHKSTLFKMLLSIGFLGIASMASEAGADAAPGSAVTSTDPDAGSADSDPHTDKLQSSSEKTPPEKDKDRGHDEHKKHSPRHWSDVKAHLRAREEQVDRALQKLLSVKGQVLQLIHGARPNPHKSPAPDPQENPDNDAPAADPQAPAAPQ
jgi:hypothetical protein